MSEHFNHEDQMIIFVDQRLIADLLFKTLKEQINKELEGKVCIDVVYSHGSSNPLRKIFKMFNIDAEEVSHHFDDILSLDQAYNRSLADQKKTIMSFKNRTCNILIATNVIEEGLDIPSCNKIIAYDKIQTPKTFIQMSGRARKIDSTMSFMCLDTEYADIKQNVEAMKNYKELLAANEKLTKIIPDVKARF